ncbi:sulfotransferase family 2 domain-containing protein [Marinobacter sp. C2H3]|uniref:sulfotransferase family 2 domain-containing protein n=1 Tax=Marinobacter sp. C2H3 TaxID=3119003 RepID=UPI00300ED728
MMTWRINESLRRLYFRSGLKRFPRQVEDSGVLFIHVPKAGGVSVSQALYGCEIGHRRAVDYLAANKELYSSLKKFSIVRHPLDRAYSAYNYLKKGGMPKYKADAEFSKFINRFPSFDAFVFDWLSKPGKVNCYIHFLPQTHFVTDFSGKLLVDKLGKLEHLDALLAELQTDWRLDLQVEHLNASRTSDSGPAVCHETVQLLQSIYQSDYESFGYETFTAI